MATPSYDYAPRPFEAGYPKEPRGHYSGPPDLRRSIPPVEGYDDLPHYGPGSEMPPYRPNQRFNDLWRNSERVPENPRLGASSSRGPPMVDSGHVAPRRTPSSYERPPELIINRYPPQEYSNSNRRSPTSRRATSRSSSLGVTDEFGRTLSQRTRPLSPRFGSQPSRVEEYDEFGRTVPHRPLQPRASSPRPVGESPLPGPSILPKQELDEFGRARRNNVGVKVERLRTPPIPVKAEPSSYPPSPSEGGPRIRLLDPHQSPPPVRHSYSTHSRTPSGSQVRPSQLHDPSSPSLLNNTQPKPLHTSPRLPLPTTIMAPPLPSIEPPQPVHDGPGPPPTAPSTSSPRLKLARDASATRVAPLTPKSAAAEPICLSSPDISAKQTNVNLTGPETPQLWHEKDTAWRVSVAPPAAVPSAHGSEAQNLRWTKNQSPPPNKAITPTGGSSNLTPNRATPSPKKPNQASDGHFGQFQSDASIKLEDVMPSLSRHFSDSNSHKESIDEVLKRNRELVDVSHTGVGAYNPSKCWKHGFLSC